MNRRETNRKEDRNRISKILLGFYWFLLVISLAIIGRIIHIQFGWEPDPDTLEHFTPRNRMVEVQPDRGEIMDCNRKVLASSTPLYTIRMDCQIQKRELRKALLQRYL